MTLGADAVAQMLLGRERRSDFATDVIGARALLNGGDPYPILGPALKELGISWPVEHRSTHPPTAFLFALPLANVPWPSATIIWGLAMLGLIVATARAVGLQWAAMVALLPFALLWPPVPWSLFQLTPIWLLGGVLAWRWRGAPYAAGAALGIASLTKLLPAVSLLPFLWRREWRALAALTTVWAVALALLLFLSPHVLSAYWAANRVGSIEQIARSDNGALLIVAWRIGGLPAAVLAGALVGIVAAMGFRAGVTTTPAWAVWIWLGIALLPIAWTYSLLPLLPWILRVLYQRHWAAQLAATLSIGAALLSPAPGSTGTGVALSIAFAGVAFGLDARERRTSDPGFWSVP
jgi:alpha-1,2-mannosyltransferase